MGISSSTAPNILQLELPWYNRDKKYSSIELRFTATNDDKIWLARLPSGHHAWQRNATCFTGGNSMGNTEDFPLPCLIVYEGGMWCGPQGLKLHFLIFLFLFICISFFLTLGDPILDSCIFTAELLQKHKAMNHPPMPFPSPWTMAAMNPQAQKVVSNMWIHWYSTFPMAAIQPFPTWQPKSHIAD